MEIVIATHNLHKLREFKQMFREIGVSVDLLSLNQFPDYSLPEETGSTFEENALLKMRHALAKLGKCVLADDSGFVVPALQGKPGVYSARYAGQEATDADNRKKLLQEMESLDDIDRCAYFECVLAIGTPSGQEKNVVGMSEGAVLEKERGGNGFGYDPLFVKNGYDKTFAELDEATKNRVSHRRKALEKLVPFLERLREVE